MNGAVADVVEFVFLCRFRLIKDKFSESAGKTFIFVSNDKSTDL